MLSSRSKFLVVILCVLAPSLAAAQDTGLRIRHGRHGETIVTAPTGKSAASFVEIAGPAGPRIAGRLGHEGLGLSAAHAPEFEWQGDTLTHLATGVRLPKTHQGCALVGLEPATPDGIQPPSFTLGGVAEYDCPAGSELSYMMIAFETDTPGLRGQPLPMALMKMASHLTLLDSDTPTAACGTMNLTGTTLPNRDLTEAQCGIKWRKPGGAETFGSATLILGRGTTFVAMTNTCVEPHCVANRQAFARFVDSFDLSEIKGAP